VIQDKLDALRVAPNSGAAWGVLGSVLRSFDFRTEAAVCLENAEQLSPRDPRWPYLHGLLLAPSSTAEAIPRLRRAVELCGNSPEAPRLRLARTLARRHLEELLRARPDFTPARLTLAQAAVARDDLNEALNQARHCTEDRRTARSAWSLISILHQRRGETNAALTASQRANSLPEDALVSDPFEMEARASRSDARELSDRAQRLLESNRLAEASPVITQLVREHPQFAEGWLLKGRWQLLSKNARAAEPSLRRHLELDPQSVNGTFQLGMALLAQQRFEEATAVFRAAIQLKPDSAPAFYNLGFALARSGRTREAVAPFRESIRHNPERIDSYILLADLYLQLGEKAEAEALLRQAEAINPKDARLATLRDKLGRQ
jgi:tetratricopeptide (TPR) repeat protein